MSSPRPGKLLLVGGSEGRRPGQDKEALELLAGLAAPHGPVLVATLATQKPEESWTVYRAAFRRMGVACRWLNLATRSEVDAPKALRLVHGAGGIYFTGGDQIRITALLGGTALLEAIHELHRRGGVIAGTSAGAAVMGTTMLVSAPGEESFSNGSTLEMAPGFGWVDFVSDTHFAERGRFPRLLGVVARNPSTLGVGLDGPAALLVDGSRCRMIGREGAVYFLDGSALTETTVGAGSKGCCTLGPVLLHQLGPGGEFCLRERKILKAG